MKKVTTRSYAAIIVAALILVGLGVYLVRLAADGGDWASFYANDSVYKNGVLNCGSVTDRNGVFLAQSSADGCLYADSEAVRTACLHDRLVAERDGLQRAGRTPGRRAREQL